MKTILKRIITSGAIILILGTVSTPALAATECASPAEIVAGLTGKSLASVLVERPDTGKTYEASSNKAGKVEEFNSTISKQQPDEAIAATITNQSACEGTGYDKDGQGVSAKSRKGMRKGDDTRKSDDTGSGHGQHSGRDFDGIMNGHMAARN